MPVSVDLVVRWGEMDALHHVNNSVYFQYFEYARIDFFQRLGLQTLGAMSEEGPILAHIECQFISPIVYPDTITVTTKVGKIGNTSLHIHHEIYSQAQKQIVAKGSSVIVMYNYSKGEKVLVSDAIRQVLTTSLLNA